MSFIIALNPLENREKSSFFPYFCLDNSLGG